MACTDIFTNTFLANKILSLVSISDLIRLRQVSKSWRTATNDDSMWLNKYIISADLTEQNANVDPKTIGHFRHMYLDRFKRDEYLNILASNYYNTGNIKYLRAFIELATAASQSQLEFKPTRYTSYLDEIYETVETVDYPVFCFNKSVSQCSIYPDNTVGMTFDAIATLYSKESTRRVKIGLEYAYHRDNLGAALGRISMVALYDGTDTPDHLCKFVSYVDTLKDSDLEQLKARNLVAVEDAYVEAIEPACQRLMAYLDFSPSITSRMFLQNIGEIAQLTIMDEHNSRCYENSCLTIRLDTIEVKSTDKLIRSERGAYYRALAERAQGEKLKVMAKQVASDRNLNPKIHYLLDHTVFLRYTESCGRYQPWLFGTSGGLHQLSYSNISEVELSLPPHPTVRIKSRIVNNKMKDGPHKAQRYITISVLSGASKLNIVENDAIQDKELTEVLAKLSTANEPLESIHFIIYLLLVGNILDDVFVFGDTGSKLWEHENLPLLGIAQIKDNHTHLPSYKDLKESVVQLKREMYWKSPEHTRDGLRDDDCESGESVKETANET